MVKYPKINFNDWSNEEEEKVEKRYDKYFQLLYDSRTSKFRLFLNAPTYTVEDDSFGLTDELDNFICIGDFSSEEEAIDLSSSIKNLFSMIVYYEEKTKDT